MKRFLLAAGFASIGLPAAVAVPPNDEIPSAQMNSSRGAALFAQHRAVRHEHPSGNIPPVFVLNYKPPEQIVSALANGPMRPMTQGLSVDDIRQLAIHLAHREPGSTRDPDPTANLCQRPDVLVAPGQSDWNGIDGDIANTRYQPKLGIAAADVPRLKGKWAFAYPGGAVYSAPVVDGK